MVYYCVIILLNVFTVSEDTIIMQQRGRCIRSGVRLKALKIHVFSVLVAIQMNHC